jgi:hypothetical protein
MADGGWQMIGPTGEALRLGQAVKGRTTLWARCSCGAEAAVDPAPWLGQGLARHSLRELEPRLRCRCGARRAALTIRDPSEAPTLSAGGIFIFR